MRIATKICTISALLAGAAVGCHSHKSQTVSQEGQPTMGPGSLEGFPTKEQRDILFMRNTAMAGMTEVELGNLAADKGVSQSVREFGRRMASDHAAADAELSRIAASAGIALPVALDADHREMVNALTRLSGPAFDREYMSMMVKDHQDAITAFERETERGTISAARQFAMQTLPTLREHLVMAHQTQAIASAEEH